jgi:hypothetical protein
VSVLEPTGETATAELRGEVGEEHLSVLD